MIWLAAGWVVWFMGAGGALVQSVTMEHVRQLALDGVRQEAKRRWLSTWVYFASGNVCRVLTFLSAWYLSGRWWNGAIVTALLWTVGRWNAHKVAIQNINAGQIQLAGLMLMRGWLMLVNAAMLASAGWLALAARA